MTEESHIPDRSANGEGDLRREATLLADVSPDFDALQAYRAFRWAMVAHSRSEREVTCLYFLAGMDVAGIAARLGLTAAKVADLIDGLTAREKLVLSMARCVTLTGEGGGATRGARRSPTNRKDVHRGRRASEQR